MVRKYRGEISNGTEYGRAYIASRYIEETGKWWAMQGLNLRPLPCEGSALPLS
jgi:hypothetical protein